MTNTHDDTDPRLDEDSSEEKRDRPVALRYTSLDLEDGAVVIYDRDNHRAWIQSDGAVDARATL